MQLEGPSPCPGRRQGGALAGCGARSGGGAAAQAARPPGGCMNAGGAPTCAASNTGVHLQGWWMGQACAR